MVPDAVHRHPTFSGFNILDFEFLPGLAARTVSTQLAARASIFAFFDGTGNWSDSDQHSGRDRSVDWKAECFRPDPKIPCGIEEGQNPRDEIPQASGVGALDRTFDWKLFRYDRLLRPAERELPDGPIPDAVCGWLLVHRTNVAAT